MGKLNNLFAWLGGRKFVVALLGLIAIPVSLHTGVNMTPEKQSKILETIGVIIASFHIGTGIADGLSKGATSTVSNANANANTVEIAEAVPVSSIGVSPTLPASAAPKV